MVPSLRLICVVQDLRPDINQFGGSTVTYDGSAVTYVGSFGIMLVGEVKN